MQAAAQLARRHPELYFGLPHACSYHSEPQGIPYLAKGPYVFRLRLVKGERVVIVGEGEHAGKFGVVLGIKALDDAPLRERAAAPYIINLDEDEDEGVLAKEHLMHAHEVKRVGEEQTQSKVTKVVDAATEGGAPTGGRIAWSVEGAADTTEEELTTVDVSDAAVEGAAGDERVEEEALVEAGETPAPAPSAPLTIRATDHALPEPDTDGAYLYEATILVNHLM